MSGKPQPDPTTRGPIRARLRALRAGLPHQACHARVATASLVFGPLYSTEDLHRRIARTLPRRLGLVRRVKLATIDRAETVIPDHVLLRYDDAVDLGVFSRFLVARPAYYWRPAGVPWLVGLVAGTEQWGVIARWAG
jgi:hypothetical protein